VAHGIEEPEERRRVGKPAVGQVVVRATTRGAMAGLEVSDDGRGVDPHKIGEEAVRRGLWVADELSRADAKQILDLLFAPGFSTATTTDRVSGRGVGLDVVRRRVDELDGTVTIGKPTLGGATFVLSVPVSHVSLSGLLVAAGRQTYALPVEHVERTLRVDSRSIESVDGAPIARSDRHEPLRLYWLATLMQRKRGVDPLQLTAVEVKLNGRRYGLVVDEVIGEEKFVAQRLPPYLKALPGFQGALVLGDGSLALVLDIPELVASLPKRTDNTMGLAQHTVSRRAPTVLVVDDSLTSRTLVHNFLKTAGYEVKVAVDGAEAWQAIKSTEVDLVIADVEMPNVDGIELTRRIRADEALNNTPVIIVSSLGSPEDIARGAAAGADDYVVKGEFDQRVLLEAISRLI
jgi:chemotaxis protein histidine kinase CheA/CheY-like chemotaxis protein